MGPVKADSAPEVSRAEKPAGCGGEALGASHRRQAQLPGFNSSEGKGCSLRGSRVCGPHLPLLSLPPWQLEQPVTPPPEPQLPASPSQEPSSTGPGPPTVVKGPAAFWSISPGPGPVPGAQANAGKNKARNHPVILSSHKAFCP